MAISKLSPPINYLQTASRTSLQSFELARLNHAANLRREIATLIDQWIEETAEAMMARCMLDNFGAFHQAPITSSDQMDSFSMSPADLLPHSHHPLPEAPSVPPRFADRNPSPTTSLRTKSSI